MCYDGRDEIYPPDIWDDDEDYDDYRDRCLVEMDDGDFWDDEAERDRFYGRTDK